MPPDQPQLNNPQLNAPLDNDSVWVSREEYDRLRNQTQPTTYDEVSQNEAQLKKQRRWQVILGGILAVALYFSVSAGQFANPILVGLILLFGIISFYDYRHSHDPDASGVVGPKALKRNPYKILTIVLLCVTVVPMLAMIALFAIFMSLGGGDFGS